MYEEIEKVKKLGTKIPKNLKITDYDYPYQENVYYTEVIYDPPLMFNGNENVNIKYLGHRYRIVAKKNKTIQAGSIKKKQHTWAEDIL